jgi:hypothetical protein
MVTPVAKTPKAVRLKATLDSHYDGEGDGPPMEL